MLHSLVDEEVITARRVVQLAHIEAADDVLATVAE